VKRASFSKASHSRCCVLEAWSQAPDGNGINLLGPVEIADARDEIPKTGVVHLQGREAKGYRNILRSAPFAHQTVKVSLE
jgi:hypothetical protein